MSAKSSEKMSLTKRSLGDPSDHTKIRKEIIYTCIRMGKIGINQGTSGNVSARVPGGMLITPSGIPYEKMTPEIICFMDEGGHYYGPKLPSSEWRIHLDIYKARPDSKAIVHAHPAFSTALSVHQRAIPAFHYMVAVAGGREIRCAEYATFGSKELSDNIVNAMSGGLKACLMANHGIVAHGANLEEALSLANIVECLSKQYVIACKLGPPTILSNNEMEAILYKLETYAEDWEVDTNMDMNGSVYKQGPLGSAIKQGPIEIREELINVSAEMEGISYPKMERTGGISQGSQCSISARVPGGMLIMHITPPSIYHREILFIDDEGPLHSSPLEDNFKPTSSEWRFHLNIYKARPDIKAIISAQSTYATALSSHRAAIPAFHYMIAVAGGKEIRCAKHATFASEELSDNILTAMSGGLKACLIPHHGIVACGDSLRKALWLGNEVECLSKQYVTACELGPPTPLGAEEMEVILTKFKTYGKQPEELAGLSPFEREHAVVPPPCARGEWSVQKNGADEGEDGTSPVI